MTICRKSKTIVILLEEVERRRLKEKEEEKDSTRKKFLQECIKQRLAGKKNRKIWKIMKDVALKKRGVLHFFRKIKKRRFSKSRRQF